MSWDIYGNRLERGHCEVHPYVHEEYPCSLCYRETQNKQRENRFYREQEDSFGKAQEEEYLIHQYCEASSEYKQLHERELLLKSELIEIEEKKNEAIKNLQKEPIVQVSDTTMPK